MPKYIRFDFPFYSCCLVISSVFNIDIVFFSKTKTCGLTSLTFAKAIRSDRTETLTNTNLTYFRLVFLKQLFCVHNQTFLIFRLGFDELLIEDVIPRECIIHALRL